MKPKLRLLLILSILSLVFSCRTTPENEKIYRENILSKSPIPVKINFLRAEFKNNGLESAIFTENNLRGGGNSLIINGLARYTEVLDIGLGAVEVEKIPETYENNEYLSHLGLTSAVKGDGLPNGAKYKILAYKKTKNIFIFNKENDFVVGHNSEIKLDYGQNYTLIIISNGTNNSPIVFDTNNIDNVNILNDDRNEKILYQRIDNFVPNGEINNKINVKLKYKVVNIRIILDASDILGGNLGKNITYLENPKISYTKREKFNLGIAIGEGDTTNVTKNINSFESLNNITVSSDFVKNLKVEKDAVFSMKFKTEDMKKIKDVSFALKNLKSGYKYTFRVKPKGCGAYLGENKTNWRQFMCHNLGSDYTKDPFTPSADIHGDKYQWGHNTPVVKQKDDIYTGSIPNWNSRESKSSPPVTSWYHDKNDPCPTGYRIPTSIEWENVLRYNKQTKLGDWENQPHPKSATTGMKLGDNLMLPTAGSYQYQGRVYSEYVSGAYGAYWSSYLPRYGTEFSSLVASEAVVFFSDRNNGLMRPRVVTDGIPIRCIKK